jgi:ppGpp synthetase/RelA/SpoT-type nucleotidyltranferase
MSAPFGDAPEMAYYEKLIYSLNRVDKAGDAFRSPIHQGNLTGALEVINNWRAAHAFPLNSLYMTMRRRAKKVDNHAINAQRLKRFESICRKLIRFENMQASQMQDVGGCRTIVTNMKQLNLLRDQYISNPVRHEVRRPTDYVLNPKTDGYRGIHFMYRFVGNGSSEPWDKLRIEIQLRTKLQHAWSTAVETVDTFEEVPS